MDKDVKKDTLEIIKDTFRDFDDILMKFKDKKLYPSDFYHLKSGITQGTFMGKLGKDYTQCVRGRSFLGDNTFIFRDFIKTYLTIPDIYIFIKHLVDNNYNMIVYRGAVDNPREKYFPSKFKLDKSEVIPIPFSTTTDIHFARDWIKSSTCCIYVINVNFRKFKKFIKDNRLTYIPLLYIDKTQEEITLGPGSLKLVNITFEQHNARTYKLLHLDYTPYFIDDDWYSRDLPNECR